MARVIRQWLVKTTQDEVTIEADAYQSEGGFFNFYFADEDGNPAIVASFASDRVISIREKKADV